MTDVETIDQVKPEYILAVVPTLNEEAHIEACIRSLMSSSEKLKDVVITVADGGSTDRTCEIVEQLKSEFPNLRLLHNPQKLQSAAINLAAKHHSSELTKVLVRCDAHSIYPENFIIDVAESLESTGADSLVIPMDAVGTSCFEKANAWIVDTPLGSGGAAHRGGVKSGYVDHGHHAGFRLDTFSATGGYDETFSHNEDAEYDERVRARGGRIYLDANIRIKYIPRGNLSSLSKQYYNYGKGRARNIDKHGQTMRVRQLIPVIVLIANLIGFVAALLFWPFIILPLGYVAILFLTSFWMVIKKKSLCGAWAGPALGAMHMPWAVGFLQQKIANKSDSTNVSNYISKQNAK